MEWISDMNSPIHPLTHEDNAAETMSDHPANGFSRFFPICKITYQDAVTH